VILKNTSDYGCIDIDTVKVFVAPEPKAYFQVTDSSQCFQGHFFDLADASTAPTNALLNSKSDWKYQNGTYNYAKIVPNKTFTSPGKYWIRIIATTAVGCKDSFQREVEVFSMPDADIDVPGKQQCLSGNKFTFKQRNPHRPKPLSQRVRIRLVWVDINSHLQTIPFSDQLTPVSGLWEMVQNQPTKASQPKDIWVLGNMM